MYKLLGGWGQVPRTVDMGERKFVCVCVCVCMCVWMGGEGETTDEKGPAQTLAGLFFFFPVAFLFMYFFVFFISVILFF